MARSSFFNQQGQASPNRANGAISLRLFDELAADPLLLRTWRGGVAATLRAHPRRWDDPNLAPGYSVARCTEAMASDK